LDRGPASYDLTYEQRPRRRLGLYQRLKRWHREWKFALIERSNPEWPDLFSELA
jgi:predicted GIY-YIG superfamily endonuclease